MPERRLSHCGTIVFIVLLVARQLSLYNFEVPYTTADTATPLVVERTDILRRRAQEAARRGVPPPGVAQAGAL